jgi:glyceraldehyde-3-phosphate dehydrogenase (NADP+)
VDLADESALDSAVALAQTTFEKQTRRMTPFDRAKILANAAQALTHRRDEFAQTLMKEAGKPITLAEGEVDRAIITFTAASEEARHGAQGEWLDIDAFPNGKGHVGFVRRFPIGVIYGMTPFNFPLNLVAHKVAPAVASGNTIVVKPSPRTPLSALKLGELLREAGAPEGQVNVVVAPNELAMRLVDDPRIKHISFTGSVPIGWQIKQRAAPAKRVTLELGGNAALIVHDDADLGAAVIAAATGAYSYAGQSCISVQRILVQKNVYNQFRGQLVDFIRDKVPCGDPHDRAVLVGPMIDSAALKRVRNTIDEAVRAGARLLIGGEIAGPCIKPALIENADLKSPICTAEIFAPVATLHSYGDFDEAIAIANDSAYGLQAGVFTRDVSRAWHAFESLEVGGVMINQAPTWRSDTMPYGGVKQSGFGREGVRYAMQEMTEPRALVMKVT